MSHFRDRVIMNHGSGNIPQLPSGKVTFNIGAYRIAPSVLSFSIPSIAAGTANATGSAFTASPSMDLGTAIPTPSVSAHSP